MKQKQTEKKTTTLWLNLDETRRISNIRFEKEKEKKSENKEKALKGCSRMLIKY